MRSIGSRRLELVRRLHTRQPTRRSDGGSRGPSIEVRPVRTRSDLTAFIKLPFRLYADQPLWVPPLIAERRRHLDRERNPFFEHAEAEYFLAWRDGQPVGRITAQTDHRFNEFQENRWGMFGFFECEDDTRTAGALLDAARGWLTDHGHDLMVGPMDFTTNHECGLLVEGHELPPQLLENWHHPYYARLLELNGLVKEIDLLKWQILASDHHRVRPVIYRLADRLEEAHGIRIRNMRKRNLAAEVRAFMDVYNSAWQRNWGFVPLTDHEFEHYARELKPVLDEKWALVAEKGDEVVGASLTLPDYNQVLRRLGGRLLPFGWATLVRERSKINEIRVFALGVKSGYEHTGVAAAFYANIWRTVQAHGIRRAETGWILETNHPMNSAMNALAGDIVKRYRVYRAPLTPRQPTVRPAALPSDAS
jgi:hypothetical protein